MAAFSEQTRRKFVRSASLAAVAAAGGLRLPCVFGSAIPPLGIPLSEFGYSDVSVTSELHENQLHQTHAVLMGLSEDSMLKPLRQMSGQSAPGEDMGGWYHFDPDLKIASHGFGFAPACHYGQWVSALARYYAITGDEPTREKVMRLNRLYARTISGEFYERNRFPTYCYDKLACALIDSHQFAHDPDALAILDRTLDTALPHFPKKAVEHGVRWRPDKDKQDDSWTWDESYTISENFFLAYQRGAGNRFRALGQQYLDDEYFGPLSQGQNVLPGRHAYSHVNALSSAMQAYLTLGSEKHLRAGKNAFEMLSRQSFATGGWGPNETLPAPDSEDIVESLSESHSSFETPCGSYAHFKLTRYLLRVTRDSRYGDSMERMMYNTVLGAKPLQPDGTNFYYSDYNFKARKIYRDENWTCCSGTLPQVAADYRINSYFRDGDAIFVNLYIPSELRFAQDGAQVSIAQSGDYPFDALVKFKVTASKPTEFALNLRIPEWAEAASVSINGKLIEEPASPGSFASIRRQWKTGDRIEMNLPLTMRLQPLDAKHPGIVALLAGPVVLFAVNNDAPAVTRRQLLAARKTGRQQWQVETAGAPLKMLPFIAITDEQYSTYLRVG